MSYALVGRHPRQGYRRVRSVNATGAFPARIPTTTEPTGDGVIRPVYRFIELIPFGTDLADKTFNLRVIRWARVGSLWVPSFAVQVACTLGTATGVAGAGVSDTELFVDTVTNSGGDADVDLISPADNQIASVHVDTRGADRIEVTFGMGTAVSANALVSQY